MLQVNQFEQKAQEQMIALENQYTSGVYGKREVVLVRGQGAVVWDAAGRAYLDCSAGYGVANVGHCHPRVVEAITQQAQTLLACPEFVYNDVRAQFQERLVEVLPAGLNRVYLCNSGAEAVEAALKFARLSTGKTEVIATMRGFHGRTMGALAATWNKDYRQPFEPLLGGVTHVPYNNLAKMREAMTPDTAAILVELVQGEGGVRPADEAYVQGLRQLCDEQNILLIFDEVQTGFGRTGRWFACQHTGVTPDLLCMGKSLAGGVPMGAVGIGLRVANLAPGLHGSTFGGNPLVCAAGLANLAVLEEENLIHQAEQLGHYFLAQLQKIESPLIREVRGLGLMLGIELKERVMPVLKLLQARGVIAMPAGATVLRLLPPLVITQAQIDEVVTAITAVLQEVEAN
jgi:acetylornithine/LysW-gamma-L-lysine aminotransferase